MKSLRSKFLIAASSSPQALRKAGAVARLTGVLFQRSEFESTLDFLHLSVSSWSHSKSKMIGLRVSIQKSREVVGSNPARCFASFYPATRCGITDFLWRIKWMLSCAAWNERIGKGCDMGQNCDKKRSDARVVSSLLLHLATAVFSIRPLSRGASLLFILFPTRITLAV